MFLQAVAVKASRNNHGRARVLEEGAGLGYWAQCLSSRFGKALAVDAFDASPTPDKGHSGSGVANEYHGKVPAFYPIQRSDPADSHIARSASSVLLLCYPPPNCSMAEEKLAAFSGEFVAYIGEFLGLTATSSFEQTLCSTFTLLDAVPLPQTGATANYLTIWQRKARASPEPCPHQFFTCMNPQCKAALGRRPLLRCSVTRAIWCCSEQCSILIKQRWRSQLALRHLKVPYERKLSHFLQPLHWPKCSVAAVTAPEVSPKISQKKMQTAPTLHRLHNTTSAHCVMESLPADAGFVGRLPSIPSQTESELPLNLATKIVQKRLYERDNALEEESRRWHKCWKLRGKLKRLCRAEGIAVPIMAFERWLTSSLINNASFENTSIAPIDPLLPHAGYTGESLVEDLVRATVDTNKAKEIARQLAAFANERSCDGVGSKLKIICEEHKHSLSYSLHCVLEEMMVVSKSNRRQRRINRKTAGEGIPVPDQGRPISKGKKTMSERDKQSVERERLMKETKQKSKGGRKRKRDQHELNPSSGEGIRHPERIQRKPVYDQQLTDAHGSMVDDAQNAQLGLHLKLNKTYRKKLQALFKKGQVKDEAFDLCLFLMLARYQAFSGHGFQAACNHATFDILSKHLQVRCECFASPLNCHFGKLQRIQSSNA